MAETIDHAARLRAIEEYLDAPDGRACAKRTAFEAADELDRLRAEVKRLTTPPPRPSVFERELATYAAHKATWLEGGYEGHHVVIRGGDWIGPLPGPYEAALGVGYKEYGLDGFMVKKIERVEPVLVMVPH